MTCTRILSVLVCLGLAGCGGRATESPAPAAKATEFAPQEKSETHANASEVRIEEGMLRDLRITTAAVESRQGNEQVTVLGELAVDEGAYAEVGVPVASRVVRLLAGVGEAVNVNQALLELQSTDVGRTRADYLTATAHLTLAESALNRKRDLAAERIAPEREVQEAESVTTAARAEVRAATAALNAMGSACRTAAAPRTSDCPCLRLHSPVPGTVIERRAMRGPDARSRHAGLPHRRSLDALADGARVRARRRAHPAGRRRRASRSRRFPGRSSPDA